MISGAIIKKELPQDINEAIELLERFEKSKNHSQRIEDFVDAIDLLDSHLAANADSIHKNRIEKIKFTYTRKMIEQLPELGTLSYEDWFDYVVLLFLEDNIKKEIHAALQQFPALREVRDAFFAIWRDQFIRELKQEGILK